MGKLGFKEGEGLPRFPCSQKEKKKENNYLSLRRISPLSFPFRRCRRRLSQPPSAPTSLSLLLSFSSREFPVVSREGCRWFTLLSPECRCRVKGYRSLAAYRFPRTHVVPLSLCQAFMLSGSRGIDVSPSRCLALSLSRSTHVSPRPVSPQPRLSLSRRFSLGFALSALALSLKSRFSLGILSHSDFWLSTAVPFLPGQNSTFK